MKKILLTLCGLCFAWATLQAATFTVINTNDSGAGSLRQALNDANNESANPGADNIVFSNTLANQTITISSPFLVITSDMTIDGSGAPNLTISGGNASRIFWIQNGTITIQNLTLANGYAKGDNGGGGGMGAGGAIFMHEGKQDPMNPTGVLSGNIDLRLINVMLKNNRAIGGNSGNPGGGGGIGGNGLGLNGGGGVLGDAGNFAGGSITSAESMTLVPGNNGGIAIFGNGGVNTSAGGFGGGGGGGRPGGNGGFGGGGGASRPGGFGGGGGGIDGAGGNGGFGGGGGNGSGTTGIGGFGGGNGGRGNFDNGGGAGFGGAIFVASGKLSLQSVTFDGNTATGGTGINNGKGYGGALFIFNKTDNGGNVAPGTTNNPQVFACNVTYTNNSAADDPNTTSNNDNFYGSILDPANNIIYVNANASGANNGTTWANAFTKLQDALSAACTCGSGEIWVAQGTYYPDEGIGKTNDDRSSTFQLCNGVKLYGGFSGNGNETMLSERNVIANVTTLSGDLDKNDTPNFGNNSNNALHVVTGSGTDNTAILDGFTMIRGNANGSGTSTASGGGLYNVSGSPSLTNCTFDGNNATFGGAMANFNSSPTLTNCSLSGNSAANFGGGMYNNINSSPTLTNCSLSGNSANSGGGMFNNNSSPTLTNCSLSGNSAANSGGGMYNNINSSPTLTNCSMSGNSAISGGGMYNNNSSATLTNCVLWNNQANGQTTTVSASIFNSTSTPIITYSLIQNITTSSNNNIDGITNAGDSNYPAFVTPVDPNTAPTTAGNLRLLPSSPAINMGNNAADLDGAGAGTTTIADITTDLAGNARILQGTVDMGAYEQLGCPGGSNVILYVNAAAAPGGDGLSWGTAIADLQDALTLACGCSEVSQIWVAKGTYKPLQYIGAPPNYTVRTFYICPGLEVYGGFPNMGNPTFAERNPTLYLTTLSGDILDNDAPNLTGVDLQTHPTRSPDNIRNSIIYFYNAGNAPANLTILDGFTITGALEGLKDDEDYGGGIYNNGSGSGNISNPHIRNCIISSNAATAFGGGLYNYGREGESSPILTNCIFSNNFSNTGAGMYNNGSGGISSPILINCQFISNYAILTAGGISNEGGNGVSSPTLTNCLFSGNFADGFAGAMFNAVTNGVDGISSPLITNCTFSGNSAGVDGGTIVNFVGLGGTAIARIQNTIIWNNEDNSGIGTPEASIFNENGSAVIFNSLIQNITTNDANGNKDGITDAADPNYPDFVMPVNPITAPTTAGDLRLQITSPAIDMGDGASVPTDANDVDNDGDIIEPTPDLDLNDRIVGTAVDMGAFESPCVTPAGTISSDVNAICAGESVELTFTATVGAGPFDIVVNGTPYNDVVSGSVFATLSPNSNTDYTLTQITDNNGCIAANLSQAISVTVNQINPGEVAGTQTVCITKDPVAFTSVTAATGGGTVTYQWEMSTTSCDSGFTPIDGATAATFDAAKGQFKVTTYFRRRAISTINGVACDAVSNCITLTVLNVDCGKFPWNGN